MVLTHDPASPFLVYTKEKQKHASTQKLVMFITTLFITTKNFTIN